METLWKQEFLTLKLFAAYELGMMKIDLLLNHKQIKVYLLRKGQMVLNCCQNLILKEYFTRVIQNFVND